MTIIITDRALSGDYEKNAKEELRDYGVTVHTIGWGDVSTCLFFVVRELLLKMSWRECIQR